MEDVLTLLVFKDPSRSPLAHFLSEEQRETLASELNEAILNSQMLQKDPLLSLLLKRLSWAQLQLAERIDFPMIPDLNVTQNIEFTQSSKLMN